MRQSSLAPRPPTHLGLKATVGAILGGAVAYGLGFANPVCIIASGLAAICVRIALIDLKRRIILDRDLIAMTAIGVTWILWTSSDQISDFSDALSRTAFYGMVLQLVKILHYKLRSRDGIGAGDIKLVVVSGFFIYWNFFSIMLLTACSLSVIFISHRAIFINKNGFKYCYIPFGAMISISVTLTWFIEAVYY